MGDWILEPNPRFTSSAWGTDVDWETTALLPVPPEATKLPPDEPGNQCYLRTHEPSEGQAQEPVDNCERVSYRTGKTSNPNKSTINNSVYNRVDNSVTKTTKTINTHEAGTLFSDCGSTIFESIAKVLSRESVILKFKLTYYACSN